MQRATKIFEKEMGQFILSEKKENNKMTTKEFIKKMKEQDFKLGSNGQHQLTFFNKLKGYIYISKNKMYGANTEHANINQLTLSHINTYISTPLAEREDEAIEMTMSDFNYSNSDKSDIDFGDYVKIEMFKYGAENDYHIFKVVGALESNTWLETPLKWNSQKTLHDEMEVVLNVIECGISETEVIRVAKKDVEFYKTHEKRRKSK